MSDYNEIKDNVFEFAYFMALRDATSRRAFDSKNKNLLRKCNAKEIVRNYIDEIFAGKAPEFDDVVKSVEDAFRCFINAKKETFSADFTFGNAQKLINMTAKYMFIATYHMTDARNLFKKCHCPLDNRIVENLISEIKSSKNEIGIDETEVEEIAKEYQNENVKEMKWTTILKQSWSKMGTDKNDKSQYYFFQELVHIIAERNDPPLIPLEVDYKYYDRHNDEQEGEKG